ncbi:MAG: hypothetical protein HZA53_17320 [Planctomycetes bacterium]|nr:hypothetical protein [Planctomycetota bacterium]
MDPARISRGKKAEDHEHLETFFDALALTADPMPEVRAIVGPVVGPLILELGPLVFEREMQTLRGRLPGGLQERDASDVERALGKILRLAAGKPFTVDPVAAIAGFHGNGRVREAAVMAMERCTDGDEIPFLLMRTNDWVEPIASAATRAVLARVDAVHAKHFARALPVLCALRWRSRTRGARFLEAIERLWSTPQGAAALIDVLESNSDPLRRACAFDCVIRTEAVRDEAIQLGLLDVDPRLRRTAAQLALGSTPETSLDALVDRLVVDRTVPIRLLGLRASWERLPVDRQVPLATGLLDANRSVRELALWHARRRDPGFDARVFYRNEFAHPNPRTRRSAILGFADVANEEDGDVLIAAFFDGPDREEGESKQEAGRSPERAAIEALGRVNAERHADRLTQLLASDLPCVSSSARRAFEHGRTSPTAVELAGLLRATPYAHVAANALRLERQLVKWDALFVVLTALDRPDPKLRERASQCIHDWLRAQNKSFLAPPPGRIDALKQLLTRTRSMLAEHEGKELDVALEVAAGL